MGTRVSVCCLTFNAERTVRQTLESVKDIADEIVVVDSGSTDGTLAMVREFTDKVSYKEYTYHGLQMNHAIDLCSHDWVFCIDSDESMDERLRESIRSLKQNGLEGGPEAFRMAREWLFLGKPVHAMYPVTSPDRIVRFFDKRVVRFNERPVHDKAIGFQKEGWLEGKLINDCIASLHVLFDKANKYTSRHVRGFKDEAEKVTLLNLVFNPPIAFLKWYFAKKNFLDGSRGLVLGAYAGMYTFLKYAKWYEIKKGLK
jgi:glycosyltransferase involved in cell wall biosynthesis